MLSQPRAGLRLSASAAGTGGQARVQPESLCRGPRPEGWGLRGCSAGGPGSGLVGSGRARRPTWTSARSVAPGQGRVLAGDGRWTRVTRRSESSARSTVLSSPAADRGGREERREGGRESVCYENKIFNCNVPGGSTGGV